MRLDQLDSRNSNIEIHMNTSEPVSPMQERWISVAEVAAYLGVKRDTIYKWLDRKKVPAHKVGRLWKFKISDVDLWVRQGRMANSRRQTK
jgi:excisionase family DNA binding protein